MNINDARANTLALIEQFDEAIDALVGQMRDEAHSGGDMDWVKRCAQEVEILNAHKKEVQAASNALVRVLMETLSFEGDGVQVGKSGLRTFIIEVSQGMLNQNLLTLTDAKRAGHVKVGEKFSIKLPDGTAFDTDLCDPGNKLRERGLIRHFYEQSRVGPGDSVILKEETSGTWRLLTGASPEGGAIITAARNVWSGEYMDSLRRRLGDQQSSTSLPNAADTPVPSQ